MKAIRNLLFLCLLLVSGGCTSIAPPDPSPLVALMQMGESPGRLRDGDYINKLYHARSWAPARYLKYDPIDLAKRSMAPIQRAHTKIVGTTQADNLRSLAAKIWMIEQARHTVDLVYYIYRHDLAGNAILGALCNAVQRGVDIRIMVDSLGSWSMNHEELKAFETCADNAGYIRDASGRATPFRARIQVVIVNALTSLSSWSNRRSHDKLIIVDGSFPGRDIVMTGGRNISIDYYGMKADGTLNRDSYIDLEILLRSENSTTANELTVGDVSSIYYTLLFLHKGNKRIHPSPYADDEQYGPNTYPQILGRQQRDLAFVKNLPAMKTVFASMPGYFANDFRSSQVRIAHELGNLTAKDTVTNVRETKSRNLNSIGAVLANITEEALKRGEIHGTFHIVSPYLFIAKYVDKEGKVIHDGAKGMLDLIKAYPHVNFEIITNSALTSDNYFTQSIIDMDMAPRLLLTREMREAWLSGLESGEFNPQVVESQAWKRLINNPRIQIYQTGRLDSVLLGGVEHYGKLHAKFFFGEAFGFVGTSNFDYRSRLYNNEMGFYYLDPELSRDLAREFELLKTRSYRWGSPEWLEMRKALMATGTKKGKTTRNQRERTRFLKGTGLIWLF
ncbi:MAG: phospholipase D-like domain-containing protein [Acidiferrobacterales bacterium]|nr:phospholipase D-like domain-containing protein [Acidiferrobacterales bacterium]